MGGLIFSLDEKLENLMRKLGHTVGHHPWVFVYVPLLVVGMLASGFQVRVG
jgi:hypothetical protein